MGSQLKRGVTVERFFYLADSNNPTDAKTGIAHSALTVKSIAAAQAEQTISATGTGTEGVTVGYWREIDSTNMPGVYGLTFTAPSTDGDFVISIKGSGFLAARRQFDVLAAKADDNYSRLGAPAGASIAADIATVDGVVDGIASTVNTNLDATVSSRSTLTAQQVWEYATRTLSSFGTLTTDTATAVWAAGTRTLSSFGTLVADIWAYASRTLTSGVFGSGARSVTFTVTNANTSAVVQGATVSIKQGGTLVNTGVTNSLGVATFNLADGSYTYDVDLTGTYVSTSGNSLTVNGTEAIPVSLTPLPTVSAGSAYKCAISGTALMADGTPYAASKVIKIRLNKACLVNGIFVGTDQVDDIAIHDSTGAFTFEAYRQASCVPLDGTASTTVHYIIQFPGPVTEKKVIPDSASSTYAALTDYT